MEIIEESRIMMNLINKVLEKNEIPLDVLGLIFSNFKTVAQKQQKPHLENLFSILSLSFEIQAKNQLRENILNEEQNNILEVFQNEIKKDLQENYPEGFKVSELLKQRGALRALTWGQKVTSIQNSLIKRFIKHGESIIKENEKLKNRANFFKCLGLSNKITAEDCIREAGCLIPEEKKFNNLVQSNMVQKLFKETYRRSDDNSIEIILNNILESLRLNRDADKITLFLCENCGYVSTKNIPRDCPHCASNKIRTIKD